MKRRPEISAALLNGLLVLIVPLSVPLLVELWSDVFDRHSNASVTVRASGASVMGPLLIVGRAALVLLPFALLAAWRTWVHAKRWQEGQVTGWRGVAESGACALTVALFVLAPGIVTRPAEAPPYVLVYGGGALVLGLLVGLILRMTALVCLRLQRTGAG